MFSLELLYLSDDNRDGVDSISLSILGLLRENDLFHEYEKFRFFKIILTYLSNLLSNSFSKEKCYRMTKLFTGISIRA